MIIHKNLRLDLSILTGLLLAQAWYIWGTGIVLLFAFVPLLLVENYLRSNFAKSTEFFWLPFTSFFVFNIAALWWIKNASFHGMLIAALFSTLMMTISFWLFTITHRKFGNILGYISLIVNWTAFEFIYLNSELSFPWLNLGNGFAGDIKIIQWYEFTGTLGGTVWVLILSILTSQIILALKKKPYSKNYLIKIIITACIFLLPIIYSITRYYNYEETTNSKNFVVLQPNIDPYLKFNGIPQSEQLDILLNLCDSAITDSTDYLVAPETFINSLIWLDSISYNTEIKRLKEYVDENKNTSLIVGVTAFDALDTLAEIPITAHRYKDLYYNSYNTALQLDSSDLIQYYHKSKLVTGVEKMPFRKYLKILDKLVLRLGDTYRTHSIQDKRTTLKSNNGKNKIGVIICYESIFGEHVTEYVSQDSANIFCIITNDGWWKDTPGHRQHNRFASLRAIETRRSIARSANTGTSSFINQKGEITKTIGWWKRSAISSSLNLNSQITFYVKYGDYIGRFALLLSLILLGITLIRLGIDTIQNKRQVK